MSESRIPILTRNRRGSPLRVTHWAVGQALRAMGWEWEQRQSGETGIGIWTKKTPRFSKKARNRRRMVLVPGFGDTPLSWVGVLGGLYLRFRDSFDEFCVLDFPGYMGFLSHQRGFDSFDLLLRQTSDLLDTLKPDVLIGHSLGGWISGLYVADLDSGRRERAKSGRYRAPSCTILCNPSGIFARDEELAAWRARFEETRSSGFAVYRPHVFGREPFWFRLFKGEFTEFFNRPEVHAFIDTPREEHSLNNRIAQLKIPLHVVWGDRDSLVPAHWIHDWVERFPVRDSPRHQAILLHGVGHSPHIESPKAIIEVFSALIKNQAVESGRSFRLGPIQGTSWERVHP